MQNYFTSKICDYVFDMKIKITQVKKKNSSKTSSQGSVLLTYQVAGRDTSKELLEITSPQPGANK